MNDRSIQILEDKMKSKIIKSLDDKVKTLNIVLAAILLKSHKQKFAHKDVGIKLSNDDIVEAIGYEIEEIIDVIDDTHTFKLKGVQLVQTNMKIKALRT